MGDLVTSVKIVWFPKRPENHSVAGAIDVVVPILLEIAQSRYSHAHQSYFKNDIEILFILYIYNLSDRQLPRRRRRRHH